MRVAEIMSADPICVPPDATRAEVQRLVNERRHLPVVAEELLIGIVTPADLAKAGTTAAALMTPDPITCTPEETVEVVAARMAVHRVRGLPVLEGGRVVGVVTTFDLLDTLIHRSAPPLPGKLTESR